LKGTRKNTRVISDFIKSFDPDIIGLVEVDNGSLRSLRQCQAAQLSDDLGHRHLYQSKYRETSLFRNLPILRYQGNAFLTRNEIKTSKFHYFNTGIKRLVIELELEKFTLFLVHLSLKHRHRQDQLKDLYTLFKEQRKPVIIAGDFNAFWGDQELHLFLAATGLMNANTAGQPTFPSLEPQRELDFILHSPEIRVTHFEIPQVTYSDHLPLVCDFEI
jgi:endonuclease/exonuclease/phosphatase family metal-dependent hydrolase